MSATPATTLLEIHTSALAGMGSVPRHFARWVALAADEDHPDADLGEELFHSCLAEGDEALRTLWSRHLTSWDFAEAPQWAPGAAARTAERRTAVYDRLRIGSDLRKALDDAVPVAKIPGPTVITREFSPWYTPERAAARSFYWRAYERKLRAKGWPDTAVASLDEASRAVVERLSDPEQPAARQAKGLVVGYVQSGKTANFTGVTAKAVDAGYRLVIVLGGTLNLLRAQTQRRLDMELIGQENILRGADLTDVDSLVGVDYVGDDADWPDFVSHGARPSALGAFDVERLTTRDNDYKSLAQGIRALEFEKREPTRPLHDPANLHHAAARVLVVKKNKAVLTKLVKDLKQIHGLLGELPTLIIDDESDQASVNTLDPKKWEQGRTERTAINGLLSQLLTLLPRAQYVGYTATPFANVFIDPGDDADIFPRDFLISLPRPDGYMGVQDFHDLDVVGGGEGEAERRHVRGIQDTTDDRLQEALDAFVLTGALKLYRADHGVPSGPFRHHTMLVHESVRMAEHAELAQRIETMWHNAAHVSTEGHTRLESLFEKDFRTHAEGSLPFPSSYTELKRYVYDARQLINKGGTPVIVVNGASERDYSQPDLDFDRTPNVWKILVGGTKLSRGFTVEGLTITYYRRTTQQADTLMQMGRWFGFRPGYRDLVRLYIGREEQLGRGRNAKTVDLYEAFEAICRDEELFRAELARYAPLIDGHPQVTPAQIPPLVAQHLPWVKPSARNKMFNAELVEVRSPGVWEEPTAYPEEPDALRHNTECWAPILGALSQAPVSLCVDGSPRYDARVGTVSHKDLLTVLCDLRWSVPERFSPHLQFLLDAGQGPGTIDDWFVIAPMQAGRNDARILGHGPFSLALRKRRRGPVFGAIRDPKHVAAAKRLAGAPNLTGNAMVEQNVRPRRGALVLYPLVESEPRMTSDGSVDPRDLVMAFAFVAPPSTAKGDRPLVRFRAIDSTKAEAAIIDRDDKRS
ncbi:Z1 domain-containing protein [Streptomyces sp. NBC_00151]|uniref:Z1 domain-containing protein n=1 Tax=Streptomyces sp. NBC_00151 TaxID=2975669 RepID=UPI002DD9AFA6|nr:Z1 domain-containing protein [Streptomyces sp. NBC_00151]WRZ41544.1 Z1 domain-containing protein [Streptomyces sp. NBC_00151]